jgi:hypothetical protein
LRLVAVQALVRSSGALADLRPPRSS